jgi:hypothetical protein
MWYEWQTGLKYALHVAGDKQRCSSLLAVTRIQNCSRNALKFKQMDSCCHPQSRLDVYARSNCVLEHPLAQNLQSHSPARQQWPGRSGGVPQ